MGGGGLHCCGGNYRSAKLEEMSGTWPRTRTHARNVSHVERFIMFPTNSSTGADGEPLEKAASVK